MQDRRSNKLAEAIRINDEKIAETVAALRAILALCKGRA